MSTIPWIAITIGLIIVGLLVGFIVFYRKRKEGMEPDYRTIFTMGIIFLPLGIASENSAFFIMSMVFIAIGLLNRSKWKDEPKWSELPTDKRRLKLVLMGGLALLVLVGIAALLYTKYLA
jgi:hypothetical protein